MVLSELTFKLEVEFLAVLIGSGVAHEHKINSDANNNRNEGRHLPKFKALLNIELDNKIIIFIAVITIIEH